MRKAGLSVWAVVLIVYFACPKAGVGVDFDDGGVHNIDYKISELVRVDYHSPGMGTKVNLFDGAVIGHPYSSSLWAWEDSLVNVFGGLFKNKIAGFNNSQIIVSGGTVETDLEAHDNAKVIFSGGWVKDDLISYGKSHVTINGGWLDESLRMYDYSHVTISGGTLEGCRVQTHNDSQLIITGGLVSANIQTYDNSEAFISGGQIGETFYLYDLEVYGFSTITIQGSGFNYDYGSIPDFSGLLTGTLADGGPISTNFRRMSDKANIILIPEPATLFLLGLGAVMLRRKRS